MHPTAVSTWEPHLARQAAASAESTSFPGGRGASVDIQGVAVHFEGWVLNRYAGRAVSSREASKHGTVSLDMELANKA